MNKQMDAQAARMGDMEKRIEAQAARMADFEQHTEVRDADIATGASSGTAVAPVIEPFVCCHKGHSPSIVLD